LDEKRFNPEVKIPLPFQTKKTKLQKKIERHLQLVALAKSLQKTNSPSRIAKINDISAKIIEENLAIEQKVKSTIQVQSLCLDWFSANLKGTINGILEPDLKYLEIGNFVLVPQDYGGKFFMHRATVICDGIEFGEIKFTPRSEAIMKPDTIIFKANNQVLYEANFLDYFDKFLTDLNLSFSHLSKIDISADGTGFIKPLILADQGEIEWSGKGDFQPFKKNRAIGMEYEGFWLGSKGSDKFARAYYKRRELMRSGKTYIEHFWNQNNLFEKCETTDIERLEFSLKNKELAKWIPRDGWEATKKMLSDKNFIAKLFHSVSKTLYSFRMKRSDPEENVSRLKKLFQLDFSLWEGVTLLQKIVNIGSKRLRALKTTVKSLYEVGLKTGMKTYKKLSIEIAQNINHFRWYEKKRIVWEAEYKREKRQNIPYIPIFDSGLYVFESEKEKKEFTGLKQYVLNEAPGIYESILKFWSKPQYQI
jgi:hypothetical protein